MIMIHFFSECSSSNTTCKCWFVTCWLSNCGSARLKLFGFAFWHFAHFHFHDAQDGLVSLKTHLWLSSSGSHFIKARESPLTARHLRQEAGDFKAEKMSGSLTCCLSCAAASWPPHRSSRDPTPRHPGKRSASLQSCWRQRTCESFLNFSFFHLSRWQIH